MSATANDVLSIKYATLGALYAELANVQREIAQLESGKATDTVARIADAGIIERPEVREDATVFICPVCKLATSTGFSHADATVVSHEILESSVNAAGVVEAVIRVGGDTVKYICYPPQDDRS